MPTSAFGRLTLNLRAPAPIAAGTDHISLQAHPWRLQDQVLHRDVAITPKVRHLDREKN